jgi:hypothetical protein
MLQVGQKMIMYCNNQNPGVPTPQVENYSWKVVNGERVSTNQRVQIDEFGWTTFKFLTLSFAASNNFKCCQ